MTPTMTVNETLATFRRKGVPMSYQRLRSMLDEGTPFSEKCELNEKSYSIWRMHFYLYLEQRGIPMPELDELLEERKAQGWKGYELAQAIRRLPLPMVELGKLLEHSLFQGRDGLDEQGWQDTVGVIPKEGQPACG